jgi:hypothetical protein
MAKRPTFTPKPPSLAPEQAVPILEGIIFEANLVRQQHRDSAGREEWIHTAEGALREAFGESDSTVQAFRTAQCGSWSPYDTEQTLAHQADTQMSSMLSVLQSAVKQLRWKLSDPKQVFLPAGSQHDAYVEIRKFVQQAVTDILIVDSWVDDSLWSFLTNVPPSCKIRILTENMKGDFALEARKFMKQHGASVEVRRTTDYHDRFIITDRHRCLHLGASIKDAGNKAFAMTEMQRTQIAQLVIEDAEDVWLFGTPVI